MARRAYCARHWSRSQASAAIFRKPSRPDPSQGPGGALSLVQATTQVQVGNLPKPKVGKVEVMSKLTNDLAIVAEKSY